MRASLAPRARLAAAFAFLLVWVLPTMASAHPLGNFTVNHYARVEPAGDRVHIVYVLDMAEIPTFQEKPRIDPNPAVYAAQRAEEIRQNLQLTLNGTVAPLTLEQQSLSFPEGAGGLQTLRLEATYAADLHNTDVGVTVELAFRDDNDPTRIGWREIVARPGAAGTEIQQASVPQQDTTNELRQYPQDLLNSPLAVREARLSFVPGAAAARPLLPTAGVGVLDKTRSAFADLANGTELTPGFILFAIGVAIVLGAAHALQPGHGKTVVAAYLVGSRGTARHALFLGGTVTATHTAGVYALGIVTLFLSQYIVPERLYPILEIGSGLLVVAIGAWLFGQRLLAALGFHRDHAPHAHAHPHAESHDHTHADGHTHAHAIPERLSWKSLLALGVSGGLLPCPEALMVLLITIAAHRVVFGLLLIVSFSTGLAAVLVGFGLLLVYARGFFGRINLSGGWAPRVLPVASALVIVIAGGVITAQALPQVL
ncbi:MAG: sulfite exporter TauE/SafE family protein [Chloroflexi bacterium]|nr:sulfite exporter TauE/SafE family protein [Chloroflexota bacterium]